MEHALFAIKPEWAEAILSGTKTVELRRVTPKLLEPGSVVVLYSTSRSGRPTMDPDFPRCAIVGEAKVESVERWSTALGRYCRYDGSFDEDGWHAVAGMTRFASEQYWRGFQHGTSCAIWLRGAVRYWRTLELYDGMVWLGIAGRMGTPLLRPPQSFCYLTADQLATIRREAGMEDPDETA